jgi:hypothetical protein
MAHLKWSGVNVSDGPGQLQHIQEWSGAGLCNANNGPGHPMHICNGLEQDCVMAVMVWEILP